MSLRVCVPFFFLCNWGYLCFSVYLCVLGGGGSVLWLETSMTSEEHMTSHHQEDHWAVICVTNWKTKVITVIKIMLLSSFERILKFRGFYETVVEADSRRSCPPPSQWVVLAYLTNTVLETMKEMLSLSPAGWPCNRWGMTQNMTDKVTATSYTTTTKAHQVSVIICLHTVCVWTCG